MDKKPTEKSTDKILKLAVIDALFEFTNKKDKMTIHRKEFGEVSKLILQKLNLI